MQITTISDHLHKLMKHLEKVISMTKTLKKFSVIILVLFIFNYFQPSVGKKFLFQVLILEYDFIAHLAFSVDLKLY